MDRTDLEITLPSSELLLDDPNPLLIFNVFAAILVNVSEVLWRSLEAEHATGTFHTGSRSSLESLVHLLTEVRDIQGEHAELIASVNAKDKSMYPIGVESLWVSPEQYRDYQWIRNRTIELFIETTVKTATASAPPLEMPAKKTIRTDLQAIQHSRRISLQAVSFGEAASALREGFKSAASALQELSPPMVFA